MSADIEWIFEIWEAGVPATKPLKETLFSKEVKHRRGTLWENSHEAFCLSAWTPSRVLLGTSKPSLDVNHYVVEGDIKL